MIANSGVACIIRNPIVQSSMRWRREKSQPLAMIIIYAFMRRPKIESRGIDMTKIAPSILAANFATLRAEINDVENAGADYIHVNVMDCHFVSNITIGLLLVEAINPVATLPLDVHLVIANPEQYNPAAAARGGALIRAAQEACRPWHRTIQLITRSRG